MGGTGGPHDRTGDVSLPDWFGAGRLADHSVQKYPGGPGQKPTPSRRPLRRLSAKGLLMGPCSGACVRPSSSAVPGSGNGRANVVRAMRAHGFDAGSGRARHGTDRRRNPAIHSLACLCRRHPMATDSSASNRHATLKFCVAQLAAMGGRAGDPAFASGWRRIRAAASARTNWSRNPPGRIAGTGGRIADGPDQTDLDGASALAGPSKGGRRVDRGGALLQSSFVPTVRDQSEHAGTRPSCRLVACLGSQHAARGRAGGTLGKRLLARMTASRALWLLYRGVRRYWRQFASTGPAARRLRERAIVAPSVRQADARAR